MQVTCDANNHVILTFVCDVNMCVILILFYRACYTVTDHAC